MTEEHVAAGEYERAVFCRGEIDLATGAFELFPIRHHFAIDAESRDATVGKDLETKMCDSFVVLDWERILAVACERHLRQERYPLDGIAGQLFLRWQTGERSAIE